MYEEQSKQKTKRRLAPKRVDTNEVMMKLWQYILTLVLLVGACGVIPTGDEGEVQAAPLNHHTVNCEPQDPHPGDTAENFPKWRGNDGSGDRWNALAGDSIYTSEGTIIVLWTNVQYSVSLYMNGHYFTVGVGEDILFPPDVYDPKVIGHVNSVDTSAFGRGMVDLTIADPIVVYNNPCVH